MMKPFLFFLFSFCCTVTGVSQEVIRQQPCQDTMISRQADSLKQVYQKDGFTMLREASVTMESEYEMPVLAPLTEGTWYHFVFIGQYTSKLYEVRMFDAGEKQVVFQQKRWGDVDGNIIAYSYVARQTQFHMMRYVQVNKKNKKNLCGYVMIFKKAGAPPQQ